MNDSSSARHTNGSHPTVPAAPRPYRARLLSSSVVALVVALLLCAPAGALDSKTEAETMTLEGDSVQTRANANASGGQEVAFYSNGSAKAGFEGEATSVTLRARGTTCRRVPAYLKVYVDDSHNATAPVGNSSGFANYSVALSGVGSGAHTLRVAFENDSFSRKCDRNAYLDYTTLTLSDVAPPPPGGEDPSSSSKPTCTDSLASRISATPSGGTVSVRGDCVYREPRITISKPLNIVGEPGAEIRGSDVWSGWTQSGDNYVSAHTVPALSQGTTPCNSGVPDCSRPEMVFVDGQYVEQVAGGADPGSGQFALNASRQVVLGSNPAGKTVEVGTRPMVFRLVTGSGGTVWDNVDVSQVPSQSGYNGAWLSDGQNVTVKNSHMSYAHGSLLSVNGGSNLRVEHNELDHGGQLCLHVHRGTLNLSENNIHDCNSEDYDDGWEAGGVKATNQTGGLWANNEVHHNNGTGLWCDIACTNVEYSGNRIHHNDKTGLFHEISFAANIHDNLLWQNGFEERKPGIRVGNSSNVTVSNNVLAWNYKGIGFERSNRCDEGCDKNDNRNVTFSGNWVIQGEVPSSNSFSSCERPLGGSICDYYDGIAFDDTRNIDFVGNAYWYPTQDNSYPKWNAKLTGYSTLSGWNGGVYAASERYMSDTEKNDLIAEYKLPASPEY